VFGAEVTALEKRVLGPRSDEEAFLVLQAWLERRRLDSDKMHVTLATELAERIAKDPDLNSVERLATNAGLSSRALQRLFRDFLGASPKWVIRRNRLQEVALRIERGQAPTMAALAAELGYTDQAHLARDFKNAVGKSPSDFRLSVRACPG
jgi:AraC-like DNA-binding protein